MRAFPLAGFLVLVPGIASAAGACSKFGSPSYQADREVSIGGETIRSKVYVSGARERQEIAVPGGRTQVRLTGDSSIVVFDPEARTGIQLPPPPPPKTRPARENVRIGVQDNGASKTVKTELRDDKGEWKLIEETVCRNDGIIQSQQFTVADPSGRVAQGQMSQSGISVGPQDATLFKVPSGVRLGKK